MRFFADLHIHSKYSMATSKEMIIPGIAKVSREKGLSLVATGDFTHPLWRKELMSLLVPCGNGLFSYDNIYFILEAEVSNIYVKNGRLRKIHNIIYVPSFEDADRVSDALSRYGNLLADGRPMLSISSEDMVGLVLQLARDAFIVPAHIWTPHFSMFGAFSGFDSIKECFGDSEIYALETGLSSDPEMNWRVSELDRFILISNSDAHSPDKLGREANCFDCEMDYFEILGTMKERNKKRFLFTIEFFPEKGKYHYDGHRKCGVRIHPEDAISHNNICPLCGKRITIGVLHRVYLLSDREKGEYPSNLIPFKRLVPLKEIISDVLSTGVQSVRVEREYYKLIRKFGSEFSCLLDISYEELGSAVGEDIAGAIIRVREGKVTIIPGYDGVYGEVRITEGEKREKQMRLFGR